MTKSVLSKEKERVLRHKDPSFERDLSKLRHDRRGVHRNKKKLTTGKQVYFDDSGRKDSDNKEDVEVVECSN